MWQFNWGVFWAILAALAAPALLWLLLRMMIRAGVKWVEFVETKFGTYLIWGLTLGALLILFIYALLPLFK